MCYLDFCRFYSTSGILSFMAEIVGIEQLLQIKAGFVYLNTY